MKRYAQILNNKAHWFFETEETLDQLYQRFAADMVFVDITDKPEVQESWDYDGANFSSQPKPSLDEMKQHVLDALKKQVAPGVVYLKAPAYKQDNISMGIYDAAAAEPVKKWINAVRQAVTEVENSILAAQTEAGLMAVTFSSNSLKTRAEEIEAS